MKLPKRYSYEPGSRLPYPPSPWVCPHGHHIDRCPDSRCVALRRYCGDPNPEGAT